MYAKTLPLLMFLCACGAPTTEAGIAYEAEGALHTAAIPTAQLDAAWRAATQLWGAADDRGVTVVFWPKPFDNGYGTLLAGATRETQANVLLVPGDEGCLFRATNSGTLEHELGHVMQFLHGIADGDAGHKDARWAHTDSTRDTLMHSYCKFE